MVTWRAWLEDRDLDKLLPLPESVLLREWKPTEEDRNAAWDLYTELRTRITTQPLHYRAGDEVTALDSVYKLFGVWRDLLHKYQRKCAHFAILSDYILNGMVRPFTAKWHKLKEAGRLANEDVRHQFREQLIYVQEKLGPFQKLLSHLAEDKESKDESELHEGSPPASDFPLGGDLVFDKLLGKLEAEKAILEQEKKEVKKRREVVLEQKDAEPTNLVGLAISGGGIRSATFALGVLQWLAEKGFLAQVDFLSTVSGGGYVGSFLSSFLNSKNAKVGPKPEQAPFAPVDNNEAPPIRHLRNHSKYLIEGTWFNHLPRSGRRRTAS